MIRLIQLLLGGFAAALVCYFAILIALFILIGFSQDVNVQQCLQGEPAGFWYGLWHGWIIGISFIFSLFNDDIAIYAINNNGNWYNLGFVLGLGGFSIGTSTSTRKRK